MAKLTGILIDSLAFAREQRSLAGKAAPGELSRLQEMLADESGSLEWRASGGRDAEGKLYLAIEVEGELHLTCQRCLGELSYALDVSSRLLLVPAGAPWPDEMLEDDSADAIPAMAEQPLLELIEDEVLLALPVAPRHASCQPPVSGADDGDGKDTPLRNLAKLRQQGSN